MYQDIKCLTDMKRVKEHVEMKRDDLGEGKYTESENSACAHTLLTLRQT